MEMNTGTRELHELEKELNVEIVPGTEIMTDVGSHHFVKQSSRVLVPQPSSDPHDPLNWSSFWKGMAITAASSVTITQTFGPLALAPMFPYLVKEFDCTLPQAVRFVSNCILAPGFGNFLWIPMSSLIGRRPAYILSQLLCIAASIWRAKATTYGSFMGASVLFGIACSPGEAFQPTVTADIFFLHDRGFWNTVYWCCFISSLTIGPVISGAMSLHVGWRNFWWFNTGLVALSLLMVIFMFPETKWRRAHPDEVEQGSRAPAQSEKDVSKITAQGNFSTEVITRQATPERDPRLGKGSPSWKQWGFWNLTAQPFKTLVMEILVPFKLFAFPIVVFSGLIIAFSCGSFLSLSLTQSQVFAAPPYNWTSQSVGFTNFAILAGGLIGLATGGRVSDWVSEKATIKNRGVREPEMRLGAMIPYVVIMILGNFIVAFGYQNHWPWEAVVIIGYSCAGIQAAALAAIANTYSIDSFRPIAGSVMVTLTIFKNLWGYGLSAFITPWTESTGFVIPIMTNMSLITFFCLCAIPFYFFGKSIRRWTKNDPVHGM